MLTDAFFVAFKLPNLLRRLFAEGAFSQAFVPILGEYKNTRSEEETRYLVDHVATLLFLVLLAVTPVSYTHLDVYKRQEQINSRVQDVSRESLGA